MTLPSDRALERRVEALEEMARAYTDSAEARDDRLTQGVERLTGEAAGLTAILNRVDSQQIALADLSRRAAQSETRTEAVVTSITDFRKSVIARTLTLGLVLGVVFFLGLVGFLIYDSANQENNQRICRERNVGAKLVQEYVRSQTTAVRLDPTRPEDIKDREIDALQSLGRSFPVVNCTRSDA